MTTASKISEYLIKKGVSEETPFTNKRLQKILYYIQAWHLAIKGSPIFADKIEAWIHGPAIRSIYEMYKSNVANPIIAAVVNDQQALGKEDEMFIDSIVSAYAKYDTATLEYMTHAEDPWQEARKGLEANESSSNEITQESMKEYYSRRLSKVA